MGLPLCLSILVYTRQVTQKEVEITMISGLLLEPETDHLRLDNTLLADCGELCPPL